MNEKEKWWYLVLIIVCVVFEQYYFACIYLPATIISKSCHTKCLVLNQVHLKISCFMQRNGACSVNPHSKGYITSP